MSDTIIKKPWGYEKIWAHTGKYVGKLLHIKRGHRLSEQFHKIKDETIYVLDGVLQKKNALVTVVVKNLVRFIAGRLIKNI